MTASELIAKVTNYANKSYIFGDNNARRANGDNISVNYLEEKRRSLDKLEKEIEQDIKDVFNTKTSGSLDKASLWDKILAYAHARVAVMICDEEQYQQCDNEVRRSLDDMKATLYADERASAAAKLSEAERYALGL